MIGPNGESAMTSYKQRHRLPLQAGMTLVELIVSCAILSLLASMALPVARYTVVRKREGELKRSLLEMREAIDLYKDLADHGQIRVDAFSSGYPPDLQTLVKGVPLVGIGSGGSSSSGTKTIRFLRRIPVDPVTGTEDWGLRSVEDDPDSKNWGGKDVFDVYSKSTGTAMDGTSYSEW
jgi:general secretion pathway protein G